MDWVDGTVRLLEAAARLNGRLAQVASSQALAERLERAIKNPGPYGVDPFGLDPEALARVGPLLTWLYRVYFRVVAEGVEHIPDGRCLIVSNHSGQLPYDGAMIGTAVFLEREPPRLVRSMVERFVPRTPFLSGFLAACGQILGTPANCRRLLEAEEAIVVFPEGVRGLNKVFAKRYRLQRFGQGFARLAMQTRTPVVPTVVIGAEEQAPAVANLEALGRRLGLPALPVTLTPLFGLLPLPVRYRIIFGPPVWFEGDANEEDEQVLAKVAGLVRQMQATIDRALAQRQGIFF